MKRNQLLVAVFALSCAAVPLVGRDLPAYSWAVLAVLVALAALRLIPGAGGPFRPAAHDLGAIALFGLAVFSLAYTVQTRYTETALHWLAICLAAYLVGRWWSSSAAVPLVARILTWAAVGTVLFEIDQLLLIRVGGGAYFFSRFLNKNIYGAFLASLLPLVFLQRPQSGGRASLVLRTIYGAVLLAGLYLTFSKGAWIAAALALTGVALILLRRREHRLLLPLLAALLIGLGAGSGVHRLVDKHPLTQTVLEGGGGTAAQRSISPRIAYWTSALRIGARAPLLGKGYGTFAAAHVPVMSWPNYAKHAHSFFLEIFAELGLVGLAVVLLTLGSSAWSWARALGRGEGPDARLPFYLAALVLLAHACVDMTLEVPESALWFWLLFGLGCPAAPPRVANEGAGARIAHAGVAVAGVAIVLFAAGLEGRRLAVDGLLRQAAGTAEAPQKAVLLSRALDWRPNDDRLLINRAATHEELGLTARATADYREAIAASPDNPLYCLYLAHALLRAGRDGEARAAAEQAMRINATIPEIIGGFGLVSYLTGAQAEGLRRVYQAARLGEPGGLLTLARQLAAAGDLASARSILADEAPREGPSRDRIRLALAGVELRLGRNEEAYQLLASLRRLPFVAADEYNQYVGALRDGGYDRESLARLAPLFSSRP